MPQRRRPRRLPRAARYSRSPKPPRGAELAYRLALRGILAVWRDAVRRIALPLAAQIGKPDARTDADEKPLDKLAAAGKALANSPAVAKATEGVAKKALVHNKAEFKHLGIKLREAEPGFDKAITEWRKENVALIESLFEKETDKLTTILAEGENRRVEDLARDIEDRLGVAQRKAELIARDQTLKLNANINEARQKAAGIGRYIWTTAGDERVRPMHQDLDGNTYSWDDPPVTNEDGDRNHPGEDYQCRCVAYPVLEELDGEAAASAEQPDDEQAAAAAEQADKVVTAVTSEPIDQEPEVPLARPRRPRLGEEFVPPPVPQEPEVPLAAPRAPRVNEEFVPAAEPVVVKSAKPGPPGEPIPKQPIAKSSDLDFAPGATLEEDPSAPSLFSVWQYGDLIGAGDTAAEAIAEAKAALAAEKKALEAVPKLAAPPPVEPKGKPVFDLSKMQKLAFGAAAPPPPPFDAAKAAETAKAAKAAKAKAAALKGAATKAANKAKKAAAAQKGIPQEPAIPKSPARATRLNDEVPLVDPKPTVSGSLPEKTHVSDWDPAYEFVRELREKNPARLETYLERSRYTVEALKRSRAADEVRDYTGGGYRVLNDRLRKGLPLGDRQSMADAIDRFVADATASGATISGTTYRGLDIAEDKAAAFWSRIEVGKVWSNRDFLSTSVAEGVAESFAGAGARRVILEIEGASGVPIANISKFLAKEGEVLYGRNRRFMVKAIVNDKRGKRILLREVR